MIRSKYTYLESNTVGGIVIFAVNYPHSKSICLADDDEWEKIQAAIRVHFSEIPVEINGNTISIMDSQYDWYLMRVPVKDEGNENIMGFFSEKIGFFFGEDVDDETKKTVRGIYSIS